MIKQFKKLKPIITELLEKLPHLRDSDEKLIANIWHSEIGKDRVKILTTFDFLSELSAGKLSSPESIRRTRAKIQEQNENLQGTKYKKRSKLGAEVRQEIHKL